MDAIGQFQHYSKYARFDSDKGRREHWPETVDRVVNFFVANRPVLAPVADELRVAMLSEGAMPSMRSVQMAGAPAERCNVSIYSCAYSPIEDIKDMADALYILMQGTGFAFSVERKFIGKLPVAAPASSGTSEPRNIVVSDTTESWCDALAAVLDAAYAGAPYTLDVSAVRPAGARLVTKGGYASGPEPLVELCALAYDIIRNAAGRRLRPFEVHRILCKIGQIVQVGGVRRAAMLSLSDIDDIEMRECKNGAFWERYPELTMANNSAAYRTDESWGAFDDEWANLVSGGSGERGIFNARSPQPARRRVRSATLGTNPCVSGDTIITTTEGRKFVRDLVDKPFIAVLPSGNYPSAGFWYVGDKETIRIVTAKDTWDGGLTGKYLEDRHEIEVTPDHRIMTADSWVPAGELKVGDRVLTEHGNYVRITKIKSAGVQAVYDCTVSEVHRFAADGIIVANCGEINLAPRQFCNLSIAIVRPDDTLDTLRFKVRAAAIFGTVQASFTDFRYIKPEWSANSKREALLGVDLQGALDNPLLQDPAVLASLRNLVLETNAEWAANLGIARTAAATCIKPSGNSGERFGTGNSLTGWYAPFFERRVVIQKSEPMYRFLVDQGVPSEEHYSDPRLAIFVFPKRAPAGATIRGSRTAVEQLDWWLTLKKHWTEHNPSATIYVRPHEWDIVADWIRANRDHIGGLSFLGFDDTVYKQAPYTPITEAEYNVAVACFPVVDWTRLDDYEHGVDSTTAGQEFACLGDSCTIG